MQTDTPWLRRLVADGILTALILAVILGSARHLTLWQPTRLPVDTTGYVLLVLAAAPLVVRRRWPLAVFAAVNATVAVYLALGYPFGPVMLTVALAMYTVAVARGIGPALAAFAGGALALSVSHLFFQPPGSGPHLPSLTALTGVVGAVSWLLVPGAIGTTIRVMRESRQRSREEAERGLLYDERLRIAQEVHDVVGHGLAAINMQAEVALHVLDKQPDHARTALTVIGRTSKEALDELRATLAVFRTADGRRPAPGLDQLDALATRMSSSGLPVTVTVTGERPDVPAAVDLAGYRIVQESLTNVLRHAGAATAAVHVDYQPDHVTIDVTDDGHARPGDTPRAGGHGILGMRERAAAVGGTLTAGPRPESGYAVKAQLPLREARS